jgi:hypothetical protein
LSCCAGGIKSFIVERIFHLHRVGEKAAVGRCESFVHLDPGRGVSKPWK